MSSRFEWKIEAPQAGLRLDLALAGRLPDLSRSALQGLIKSGAVQVDGRPAKPSQKLKGTERICWEIPEAQVPSTISPTKLCFNILFEDDHMIAIDKPAGLVVHPGAGREGESVVSALLSHTGLCPIGAPTRPGVVHRLDKGTSGVMLLAKTNKAHQKLARMFAARELTKEYLAIVQGRMADASGRIEIAIERDRVQRKRMRATSSDRGRMAVTTYLVEEVLKSNSLVRVGIETGRTHQIRVHFSYLGHPLLGDVTYGGRRWQGKPVHFLHSARIRLVHPITQTPLDLNAELPPGFQQALHDLR